MMETFIVAAVSLTMAVSLAINKKRSGVFQAYTALCLAVFIWKGGAFLRALAYGGFWKFIEYIGLIAIPPATVAFAVSLFREQAFVRRRDVAASALFAFLLVVSLFTPFGGKAWFPTILAVYTATVLAASYLALLAYIKQRASGVERKRMTYLAAACATAAILSAADLLRFAGYDIPPFSNLFLAALMYFALLIIAYPHLTKLHELMARTLVIAILTALATLTFFLITGLFGKGAPPFTHVLVASFVIVIFITPVKVILKWLFTTLYPDSRDVFTSLYAFDERLEREKSMMLEEMAPVLAHEIRNPLGSIKSAAQYLRSEAKEEESGRLLDVIIEEVDRLNGAVSQFLNYARPYALNLGIHDANQFVRKALALVRASHLADHVAIEEDLHPDLPPVKADAEQIIQVLLNIALNAIEAMPGGGSLSIRTSKIESDTGDAVAIAIRDTGMGMKKEEMRNIFKPFFTTKERGVGLGLAICQRIVRDHGGRIRVKSIPGQGSVFLIRLEGSR